MKGLGWPEVFLIVVIVLLVLGAGKLPAIGSTLGKSVREFRRAARGEGSDGDNQKTTGPRKVVIITAVSAVVLEKEETGKKEKSQPVVNIVEPAGLLAPGTGQTGGKPAADEKPEEIIVPTVTSGSISPDKSTSPGKTVKSPGTEGSGRWKKLFRRK